MKPSVSLKPGSTRLLSFGEHSVQINLVENAAVGKVSLLRLCPAAEFLVNGDELHLAEIGGVFGGDGRVARAVKILRRDFLAFVGIKIFQILLRHFGRVMAFGIFVHHRHRRLGQNAQRRRDDFKLVRAEFLEREVRLVFPRQQHVADAALGKRDGRAARAGIQHRHVFVELA